MNTAIRALGPSQARARPAYEGLLGLLLVGLLLLSTLDETALAPVGRGLLLVCFALLTIVNAGAALGVYIGAAVVFSVHHYEGQGSWVQRPDNYALLFLWLYLIAGRCFTRSAGTFGSTAAVIGALIVTAVVHLVAIVGADGYWLAWFSRMFVIPLGLFVLLRRAALSDREMRALLLIVAALGVYMAVVSLLEVLNWRALIVPPWLADPELNATVGWERAGGLAMQPEWNALDLSLTLCVLLLRLDQRMTRASAAWLAAGALSLLAIFFTYTRAAWAGLLVGGVPLFWQMSGARGATTKRRAIFISCALGFAAFVLFFPTEVLRSRAGDSGTVFFRFRVWAAGFDMLMTHPFFGVGFGQFGSHVSYFLRELAWLPTPAGPNGATIAHNTFLSVAAELGLVGLVLYVLTIYGVFKSARQTAGNAWGLRGQSWVAGFTLVYHVNVQFVTAHWLTPNILYFGIMGAIAGMQEGREGPRRPQPAAPRLDA
jgi:O-antigen ligase